ncbi:MAG: glycosyl transferase [Candidatus Buchananbacteria bacterium CG10_big_fil_rev_8_21_14_0_10_42_9]|uniref:Glycosyl transferase n=1 Tax=Candidatus Buchananbacteria bacterium CG10_big_fil_rev_8_21_14_0_10_42_9 TaxID=1974526 RepID=A0A2H0W168_9BACT|nr:MAG: glycosyl transferase [Candidatus Buchananbacteria bacterium CG10_big_fil_rev_8_21_14_0_10_42_9]
MSKPFFSVVIATYNMADTLAGAINSVTSQSEKSWELIVVDDGSKDNTKQIVNFFIKEGLPIKYFYHQNSGLGISRNVGINQALADWVVFVDADDEFFTSHLAVRRTAIEQNPDVGLIYGPTEFLGSPLVPDKYRPGEQIHINQCFLIGTAAIKKEVLLSLSGFKNIHFEDTDLFERIKESGVKTIRVDNATHIYRNFESQDRITHKIRLSTRS